MLSLVLPMALYQTNKLEATEVPKNPGSPPTPCILVSPRSIIPLCEAGHSFISLGYPVPFKTETLLARCSQRKMKRKGKGKHSARTKLESDPCLGNASRAVFRVSLSAPRPAPHPAGWFSHTWWAETGCAVWVDTMDVRGHSRGAE